MGTCCSSQNADKPKLPEKQAVRDDSISNGEAREDYKSMNTTKLEQKVNFVPKAQDPNVENSMAERKVKGRGERKIKGRVIFNDKDGEVLKENIDQIDKKMSRQDVEFVIVSLMKHFFFSNLSDDEL